MDGKWAIFQRRKWRFWEPWSDTKYRHARRQNAEYALEVMRRISPTIKFKIRKV